MESHKNHDDQNKLRFSQRFLLLFYQTTIISYLLIIFTFQFIVLDEIVILTVIPENIIILTSVFVLLTGLLQLITYKLWIPMMKKKDDINRAFTLAINIFGTGGEFPSLFGLIIGLIGYSKHDYLFLPITLPFILLGFFHKVILYFFVIKPFFAGFHNK